MSLKFVNIHGDAISEGRMQAAAAQQARRKAVTEKPAEFHKGFKVVGHPPPALEQARTLAIKRWQDWHALNDEERKKRRAEGEKEPKPWDEPVWRSTTKPKAVRSKPYEVPEAAEQCAAMARKAGWLDVAVVAIAKSKEAASA